MECNDKLVLPLNENPSIKTATHYAYPLAIIESKELAIITVNNFNNYDWNERTQDTSIHIEEEKIKVLEEVSGGSPEAVLWRNCEENDEIVVHMDYFKSRDTSRYFDVFLFADDLDIQMKQEDKTCGVRWNPYGYFIVKNMYTYDTKQYKYIKFCIENECFISYASIDGVEWKCLDRKEIPELYKNSKLKLGIHMYFGKDYYRIWKNMNFIQIIYNGGNIYKGIFVDYYFAPRKNYSNCYGNYNNYLDVHYDLLYDALDCFGSIHEYIHWNIQHLYYLDMCLDELYVYGRASYNKAHHNHYSLFFGYDDTKRVYYIMGYGVRSIPVISELSYDIIDEHGITNEKIVRYRYNMNEVAGLKFNINAVKTGLYELLHDIDSSQKVANLMTGEKLQYGLSVIKSLAIDKVGKQLIRSDRRIPYFFTEHCRLMSERLDFLYESNYLKKKDYDILSEQCKEIMDIASVIMGLIMKSWLRNRNDDKADRYLLDFYEKEKNFLQLFLNCLEE